MGLGKVIGWGIALGLFGGFFLIVLFGVLAAIALGIIPPMVQVIRASLGAFIMLGILVLLYRQFKKALREYRAMKASRAGKPQQ